MKTGWVTITEISYIFKINIEDVYRILVKNSLKGYRCNKVLFYSKYELESAINNTHETIL
jgi:hypothetical protein